jgi:hypothetical protein
MCCNAEPRQTILPTFIVFTFPKPDENPKENVENKNLLKKYRVQYFQGIKTKSIKISENEKISYCHLGRVSMQSRASMFRVEYNYKITSCCEVTT